MKLRRAISALGMAFALSFGLMLAPSQADAATLTINPRANAVESGEILAAPAGAVFNITVYDAGLSGRQKTVSYTAQTGNTLRQVANKIVQAINADTNLQAIGVTATLGTGSKYTIQSASVNGTFYRQITTEGGSNRLAVQETLTIGGTVTVDDKLTLTIFDAGLVGGQEDIVYKPNTGDTIADIVVPLRNKINNSISLSALGIKAKVKPTDSNVLLIESPTFDTTQKFTTYSAKVKAGGTETMTLGGFWGTNGAQSIAITGPIVVGETVQFTIFNSELSGSMKTVSYVTQAGDNLNQIRCGLRTEVNNDTDLAGIGVHAVCGGGVLTLTSNSEEQTSYRTSAVVGVDCAPITTSLTLFPRDRALFCISTLTPVGFPQFQNIMLQTLITIGQSGTDAAFRLSISDSTWYEFTNHDDYYLVESSNPQPPNAPRYYPGGSYGATQIGNTFTVKIGTATIYTTEVFENTTSDGVLQNKTIAHTTAHETGHHLDHIYDQGSLAGFSATPEFQTALDRDIQGMNLRPACAFEATDGYAVFGDPPERIGGYYASSGTTTPNGTGGLAGLFSGAIAANGSAMCNDRVPTVAGSDNFEKLRNAYPFFAFNWNRGRTIFSEELFAEEYAVLAGFPDAIDNNGNTINGNNNAFNTGAFVCTMLYVRTLTSEGRMPTADELHNTGYSKPDVVGAGGPDAGAFGFGERLHACDGTIGELGHYTFGS